MPSLNVWVPFYDDLDWLTGLVETVPDGIHVYAVDGRHATFPGDHDLTPLAERWCSRQPDVTYCSPDKERLPWGHEYDDPRLRGPQYEKACYANYEVLPSGAWTLKLDTDERIRELDVDAVFDLNRKMRYSPRITPLDERNYQPQRLYVPRHWTFWLADQFFPRDFYPRDTPPGDLFAATIETNHGSANWGGLTPFIHIENIGAERPREYRERRRQQLERMGRHERAAEYHDSVT